MKTLAVAHKETAAPKKAKQAKQAAPKAPSRAPYLKPVRDKVLGDPVMVYYAPDKMWYPGYAKRINKKGAVSGGTPFAKDTVLFAWAGPYKTKSYEVADATDVVEMKLPKVGDTVYAHFDGDWYESTVNAVANRAITFVCKGYEEDGEYVSTFPYNVVAFEASRQP